MINVDNNTELYPAMPDEVFENGTDRELIKHVYMQVMQSQVIELQLKDEINKLRGELNHLKKEISRNTFFRSYWNHLRYDHRLKEVVVNDEFRISFRDSEMTDLLDLMFFKSNNKPRSTKWQTGEVAERFKLSNNTGLSSANKVYKVAHRINKKLQEETNITFLAIKPKEFCWVHTN